jgi:hypothetical protein
MTAKKAKPVVAPEVQEAINTIDAVANDPAAVAIIQATASKIPPKTRNIVYIVGIALGVVVAAAAAVNGALTGNVADVVGTVGGLAYSLSNLLAKAHLNVPPAEDAKP